MRRVVSEERGAIAIMLALLIPVIILFASFAIDIANFWVHKRHLQTMADAAALAGASAIGPVGCDEAAVAAEVTKYAGGTYNPQVGKAGADRVHVRLNQQTYYSQASPVDSEVTGTPCETMSVDVKMTETESPWLLRKFDALDFINAHARVEVLQTETAGGMLPIGVPEVNPKKVAVQFVDEVTNTNIGSPRPLNKRDGSVGGDIVWDNATDNGGTSFDIPVESSRIGVRVIVSGTDSLTCGELLVECYDADGTGGLLFLRGWSAAPTVATGSTSTDAPQARTAFLLPGTCPDAYFVVLTAACKVNLSAKVDFSLPEADLSGNQSKGRVRATVGNVDYPMTYNTVSKLFETGAEIPVAVGAGPVEIGMRWEQRDGKVGATQCGTGGQTKPCEGTFAGPVQRVFSSSPTRSGPVEAVSISDQTGTYANSIQRCSTTPEYTGCTRNFVVSVTVQGSFEVSEATDPPTVLRIGSEAGSQNQGLDCDPFPGADGKIPGFADELALGCGPDYKVNSGTACPGSPQDLWASAQPWECVAVETGDRTNMVAMGLNRRILGIDKPTSCTAPNNWPDFEKDDPRIAPVFLVPFGAFAGTGQTTVPVARFAYFYVTGWVGGGGGFANPCYGAGDDPVPGNDRAAMAGHFIKYVNNLGSAGSGGKTCDLASLDGCVAVMTR